MSSPQEWNYRVERPEFPPDFAQRLERLREASGLSWRALARELRVRVRVIHRWRAGGAPSAAHLVRLLEFADERGLLRCLLPAPARTAQSRLNRSETDERSDWNSVAG